MKALDIMEAAGGIDDEIHQGGHIGYAGKEYRKTPSREADASHRADRGGARARACRERPCRRTAHQQSRAGGQGRAAGNCRKCRIWAFSLRSIRFFDGEPDYLGEAPNMGVSDYWFGRIFPHSYIVRGGTDDGKYYMNIFVDTMSGKIVQLTYGGQGGRDGHAHPRRRCNGGNGQRKGDVPYLQ